MDLEVDIGGPTPGNMQVQKDESKVTSRGAETASSLQVCRKCRMDSLDQKLTTSYRTIALMHRSSLMDPELEMVDTCKLGVKEDDGETELGSPRRANGTT